MEGIREDLQIYIKNKILSQYRDFDKAHDQEHIIHVITKSCFLADQIGVDKEMAYVIGAYHDLGMQVCREQHAFYSAKFLIEDKTLLQWFTKEQCIIMAEAVEDHSTSLNKEPRNIYGKIVNQADKFFDAETVIKRSFLFGISRYPNYSFEEQVKRVYNYVNEKYGENGRVRLWFPIDEEKRALLNLQKRIKEWTYVRTICEKYYNKLLMEKNTLISKEDFLTKYGISDKQFSAAEISWDELNKIYADYCIRRSVCMEVGKKFQQDFFGNSREEYGINSVYWRVKDPEHLIAKIIRKRTTNYKKYKNIRKDNYWKIVTDLVGFRVLLVFKEEWPVVHDNFMKRFVNDPQLYFKYPMCVISGGSREPYLVEEPKAHIREGDDKKMYEQYLSSENIMSKEEYRSVHYVISYHDVCIEIQVRTLFEEAFAEMDHKIRYPYRQEDEMLTRYAGIVNYLAGAADKLGSFYVELAKVNDESKKEEISNEEKDSILIFQKDVNTKGQAMNTPIDCLKNTLQQ